jgi:hypothetical protein
VKIMEARRREALERGGYCNADLQVGILDSNRCPSAAADGRYIWQNRSHTDSSDPGDSYLSAPQIPASEEAGYNK